MDQVLEDFPISTRMTWYGSRKTIRPEDEAYCLLGIFGVNMPLLHGEGRRAFQRLQQVIIRQSSNPSIFAHANSQSSCMKAMSPSSFYNVYLGFLAEFLITNSAVRFGQNVALHVVGFRENHSLKDIYTLNIGVEDSKKGIHADCALRKLGPGLSYRHPLHREPVMWHSPAWNRGQNVSRGFDILSRPTTENVNLDNSRDQRVQVRPDDDLFLLLDVLPDYYWDWEARMTLRDDRGYQEYAVYKVPILVFQLRRTEYRFAVLLDQTSASTRSNMASILRVLPLITDCDGKTSR